MNLFKRKIQWYANLNNINGFESRYCSVRLSLKYEVWQKINETNNTALLKNPRYERYIASTGCSKITFFECIACTVILNQSLLYLLLFKGKIQCSDNLKNNNGFESRYCSVCFSLNYEVWQKINETSNTANNLITLGCC